MIDGRWYCKQCGGIGHRACPLYPKESQVTLMDKTKHKERTGHERHGRCRVCHEEVHEYPFGIDHPTWGGGDVTMGRHDADPVWTCCQDPRP